MDIAGFTRQVERDGTAMVFPSLDDAAGARGEAACHLPSIVEVLLKISQLICAHPEIREIDLNPLIVNQYGAVIVDSRIML